MTISARNFARCRKKCNNERLSVNCAGKTGSIGVHAPAPHYNRSTVMERWRYDDQLVCSTEQKFLFVIQNAWRGRESRLSPRFAKRLLWYHPVLSLDARKYVDMTMAEIGGYTRTM